MRKVMCLLLAMLFSLALVCPVFADGGADSDGNVVPDDSFVPSIGDKPGPEIVDEETGCVVVTSLKEAQEKTTDIYQEDRNLLWKVFEKLNNGSIKLPLDEDYVIRELVDVSFKKTECVEAGHDHKQWLAEDNTQLEVVFDLGIEPGTELKVLAYINEEWTPVEAVVNADGTVTCTFEDFCPVAFCVPAEVEIPFTGDAMRADMTKWILLMAASVCALVVLVLFRRRIFR